jgi:hypothetical protein
LDWHGALRPCRRAFGQRHPHAAHPLARGAEVGAHGRGAAAGGLHELRRFEEAAVLELRHGVHPSVGVYPHAGGERPKVAGRAGAEHGGDGRRVLVDDQVDGSHLRRGIGGEGQRDRHCGGVERAGWGDQGEGVARGLGGATVEDGFLQVAPALGAAGGFGRFDALRPADGGREPREAERTGEQGTPCEGSNHGGYSHSSSR